MLWTFVLHPSVYLLIIIALRLTSWILFHQSRFSEGGSERSEKKKDENGTEKNELQKNEFKKWKETWYRIVSKCLCHLSHPLSLLVTTHFHLFQNLSFLSPHFPFPVLSISLPLVFLSLVFSKGRFLRFCCVFGRHTWPKTHTHTNGKQIAGPVKWKKIDYLYLVTEHTHACACSKGGGGHMLGRCIEPSQEKPK